MVAKSDLSYDGEIYVVPAHGRDAGEYIPKLGRVWMPKVDGTGLQESWSRRLNRLLIALESRWSPDIFLIDSRAGIDEVASACITDLGAKEVLLFAMDGEQTWTGYTILFSHWHRSGVVCEIRDRLQILGAMIPEENGPEYYDSLRERSWETFVENLYDDVPAVDPSNDYFGFDKTDDTAPHSPLPIRWNRGFAAMQSIYSRFRNVDTELMALIFGPMIEHVKLKLNSQILIKQY